MNPIKVRFAAGVLLIFSVYFYFLIFAQFAFLELVRSVDASELHIQQVMGAMALGGLIGSFTVPLLESARARSLVRFAFLGSSVTAMVASQLQSHSQVLGLFTGLFVGIITVGVAVMLRELFTPQNWSWGAALGTGLAYFACNLPLVFQSSATGQAMAAAAVTLVAVGLLPGRGDARMPERQSGSTPGALRGGWALTHYLVFFGILVWFDSAVFYIIQHSALKEATWGTVPALWRNAAIHLLAALLTGALIRRWGFPALLLSSFALLAIGSIAVKHHELRFLAGWIYPAGVSVYSACLVAFPAFGPISTRRARIAWLGAALYAVSGWICSGLGIGMAQNIHEVPWQFVVISAVLIQFHFF